MSAEHIPSAQERVRVTLVNTDTGDCAYFNSVPEAEAVAARHPASPMKMYVTTDLAMFLEMLLWSEVGALETIAKGM